MQHWDRDPKTGDYVMQGGAPKQTNSLRIPAFLRLKINRREANRSPNRKGWIYAPDDRYGSGFYLIRKNQTVSDRKLVEHVATEALSPLVEDGRASVINNTVTESFRHAVQMSTKITTASGQPEEALLTPIGVG